MAEGFSWVCARPKETGEGNQGRLPGRGENALVINNSCVMYRSLTSTWSLQGILRGGHSRQRKQQACAEAWRREVVDHEGRNMSTLESPWERSWVGALILWVGFMPFSSSQPTSEFIYYLFRAALGLRCCTWAFSSCSEQGLLFVVVHRLLMAVASLVAEHGL